jgi:DNA repair exonuclease SbcCD ATPase subunit
LPSADATELVLGRAAVDVFEALPAPIRHQLAAAPDVIRRLERDAEALRRRGDTGERLQTAVAALESMRIGMLRMQAGGATMDDLTEDLERAREIADRIDAELEARREVKELLKR